MPKRLTPSNLVGHWISVQFPAGYGREGQSSQAPNEQQMIGKVTKFSKVSISIVWDSLHQIDFSLSGGSRSEKVLLARRKNLRSNGGLKFSVLPKQVAAQWHLAENAGFRTKQELDECLRMGFEISMRENNGTITDEVASIRDIYLDCKWRGFPSKTEMEEAKALGFGTKDE